MADEDRASKESPLGRPPGADDLDAQAMLGRICSALTGVPAEPVRVGRFEIVRMIGRGGMGSVYEARDPNLGRVVALKVIDAAPGARTRVLAEARALARVRHAAVVQVHDAESAGDQVYIAMEYIDGQRLDEWLESERPSVRDVVRACAAAGAGLAAAHAAGVVHGDFKPQNVLVATDGGVKVVDFGLARVDHHTSQLRLDGAVPASAPGWTAAGAGTPAYMAPEQVVAARADHRSDQFSFCVTLFEALSGRRPFGKTGELDRAALHRIPAALRAPLLRGLAKDGDARFPSMTALLDALRPRRRWPLVVGAAVGLAAAVTLVVALRSEPTGDAPPSGASVAELATPAAAPARTAPSTSVATVTDLAARTEGAAPTSTAPTSAATAPANVAPAPPPPAPSATTTPAPTTSRTTPPSPSPVAAPPATKHIAAASTPAPTPKRGLKPSDPGYVGDPNSPEMRASVEVMHAMHAEEANQADACLRMLDRAHAIDPRPESRMAAITRARCEMRLGRCDVGVKRQIDAEIADGRKPDAARAEADRISKVLCPPTTGPLDERLARLYDQVVGASMSWNGQSRCTTQLTVAEGLLAETLTDAQQKTLSRSFGRLASCLAKLGACDEARRARAGYLRLTGAPDPDTGGADWAAVECTTAAAPRPSNEPHDIGVGRVELP